VPWAAIKIGKRGQWRVGTSELEFTGVLRHGDQPKARQPDIGVTAAP